MQEDFDLKFHRLFKKPYQKKDAFDLLVIEYQKRLYWHIRKIVITHEDADDVLQNTLIKVWKGLDGFKAKSKLYTWLYRIATNEALDFLRKETKRSLFRMDGIKSDLVNKLEGDVYFSGDELQLEFQKALIQLPEKQRLVFNMKYFDEMKYSEMSQILNTSEGALKASYHHAVHKIKKFIKVD